MVSGEDTQFLALLVHRGLVLREVAERVFPELQRGGDLDELLVRHTGLAPETIEKWRRTRAGEIPVIPGYEILGKAGSGGTADVFRAREKKTHKVLALKVLNVESTRNPRIRAAFVSEARLLEKLGHPGLVKGFGVYKSGSTYFSKMEFVEGHTLLELLDDGHAFDEKAALRVVLSVAEALHYLAANDIVHRDIKPGNIMLASSGELKLIDLGFAGRVAEAEPTGDTTVGTVQYLSPEQAQGGAADERSDIYSLGVTLFHLVVGRLPFASSDDREVLRMQVMESLKSPELKSRGLSHHLQYFIEKMMAKDAEARYQSWQELIDDVRSQIEGREELDFESQIRARAQRRRGGGWAARPRPPRRWRAGDGSHPLEGRSKMGAMTQRGGNSASAWVIVGALAVGAGGAWGWFYARPEADPKPPAAPDTPSEAWSVTRREAPTQAETQTPPDAHPAPSLVKAPASSRFAELNNDAVAALERGELEHAVSLFERCVEGDPAEPVFRRNLAEALTRWAVHDHQNIRPCPACVERLERACSLAPDREDLPRLLERWRRELETEGEFHRVQSVHFELAYEVWRGKLLDETANVLEALENDYVDLAAIFGVRPAEDGRARIPVSLYRPAEFSNITGLAEWAGAAYDGVIRAPVADDAALDEAFDELLRHELIHAFVRELGGRSVPGWLNEGLAQLFQRDPRVELERARKALRGAELIDLARLQGALTSLADRKQVGLAYAQSLAFCAWIEQQYGRPVLVAMVKGCATGRTAEATFAEWSSVELGEAFAHFAEASR